MSTTYVQMVKMSDSGYKAACPWRVLQDLYTPVGGYTDELVEATDVKMSHQLENAEIIMFGGYDGQTYYISTAALYFSADGTTVWMTLDEYNQIDAIDEQRVDDRGY